MKEVQEIKADETLKKKRRTGIKAKLSCLAVITFLISICIGIFGILWFGGFVKQFTCNLVVEDSKIWDSFECSKSIEPDVQFITKQLDPDNRADLSGEELISQVFENSSSAVVGIGIMGDNFVEDQIIGTGFIVTDNGLVVTNRHVVEREDLDYFLSFKDSEKVVSVEKIYRDPVNDLALIQIKGEDYSVLPLGDSDGLKQGQTVIAIGNPLGRFSGTVTSGIISGLNREVQISEGFFSSARQTYQDVIQTDAAINPGNSGGPLLNLNGEVIGINFATISGADNLSFAIPINRIKTRISELNEYGYFRIPFIGVEYRLRIVFVDNQSAVGAEIMRVLAGEPAAKAGLKRGDVIIEFNGKSLEEDTLFALIQQTDVGQEVKVTVLREKATFETTVRVGERGEGF